jgi:hypothetical protein
MTKLGSYSSAKNYKAWMAQRILNAAPEWTKARSFPVSIAHQLINPLGCEIQETVQQLLKERNNMFLSLADMNQLDSISRVNLPDSMSFAYSSLIDSQKDYVPPRVFTTLDNIEYEISQAENNNLETLTNALPSRISISDDSFVYQPVLEETTIANLSSAIINDPSIPGNLYITIKGNTNWQVETFDKVFYCKVYITGALRKGIKHTEAVAIRYNSTFKTNYEWAEIEEIFVSYMSEDATISIDCFPTYANGLLDYRNLFVSSSGYEKTQYLKIEEKTFGTVFLAESYAANEMDMVRAGSEEKDTNYSLELLNSSNNNVSLSSFIIWPNTDLMYGIDDTKLYIYDTKLQMIDGRNLEDSPESKFDLYVDKYFCNRDDTITINTRNLATTEPPFATRWTLIDPDGIEFYIDLSGTLWPTSTNLWIENLEYSNVKWREQQIQFSPNKTGLHIFIFEAKYVNEETLESVILNSKTFIYVPAINPEVEFDLPVSLQNADSIVLDSDSKVWILKNDTLYKLDIFFDYFLADYESNVIWLRENYDSIRVVLNE